VPGGWRDVWDGPDDIPRLRAEAEAAERRLLIEVARIGQELRKEIAGGVPYGTSQPMPLPSSSRNIQSRPDTGMLAMHQERSSGQS
jgi:hypothetical protein